MNALLPSDIFFGFDPHYFLSHVFILVVFLAVSLIEFSSLTTITKLWQSPSSSYSLSNIGAIPASGRCGGSAARRNADAPISTSDRLREPIKIQKLPQVTTYADLPCLPSGGRPNLNKCRHRNIGEVQYNNILTKKYFGGVSLFPHCCFFNFSVRGDVGEWCCKRHLV